MEDKNNKKNIDPQFFKNQLAPEKIIEHIDEYHTKIAESTQDAGPEINHNKGMFVIKPANQWITESKKLAIPKMLFDEFWHEGELCTLFADTYLGKSILGVQIGNSITKGEPIPGFKLEAEKQKVLYFDFELSDKQFESRYSVVFKDHYVFDEKFLRAEINPDVEVPQKYKSFEEFLPHEMERIIKETQAKILIIDNITYLKNETERAKDALPLMKYLKAFKKKYGLSILALGHTPKRDLNKPLTRNDLMGSKMLMAFTDSSFVIGESSTDSSIRYLKQIKVRYTAIQYDSQNVCVCHIVKPANFLMFEFIDNGMEANYLGHGSGFELAIKDEKILDLHKQGMSQREIAKNVGVSAMTVSRTLKKKNENKPA